MTTTNVNVDHEAGDADAKTPAAPAGDFQVEVFYDGECPLCRREIAWVRRLDRRGQVLLTDIAAEDFDPAAYGKTVSQFMDEIQGRLPDGSWITGVEVFRRLYAAVGFGWLVAVTRLPGVSHLANVAYRVFARNRLRWTGRCDAHCAIPEQD